MNKLFVLTQNMFVYKLWNNLNLSIWVQYILHMIIRIQSFKVELCVFRWVYLSGGYALPTNANNNFMCIFHGRINFLIIRHCYLYLYSFYFHFCPNDQNIIKGARPCVFNFVFGTLITTACITSVMVLNIHVTYFMLC